MPFTAAHPAAAIPLGPLLGRYGSTAALVIGSITPDVAYFLPLEVDRSYSHSALGLLWFCLPVGVLLYVFFFLFLGPLFVELCPESIVCRLPRAWQSGRLPSRRWSAVLLSITIGALTHIIWDSFTHGTGTAVRLVPVLSVPLVEIGGYTVYIYKVLQHGSTVVGVSLLAWWALSRAVAHPADPEARHLSGATRGLISVLVLAPPALIGATRGFEAAGAAEASLRQLQLFIGTGVVYGGAALGLSLFVASIGWRAHLAHAA